MTPKEFLQQVKDEATEVDVLRNTIEDAESFEDKLAGVDVKVDAAEYKAKLKTAAAHLVENRAAALDMIGDLKEPKERAALISYYLSDKRKSIRQMGGDIDYDERNAFRIYKDALKHLEFLHPVIECQSASAG